MLALLLSVFGIVFVAARMQPFINRLRGLPTGPQLPQPPRPRRSPDSASSSASVNTEGNDDGTAYKPTPVDVVVARALLSHGLTIPPDVVDVIFDFAEYWAHSSNEIDYSQQRKSNLTIHGRSSKEDRLLLRSFPVGLTGTEDQADLEEILRYDTKETEPRPLRREHPLSFFSRLARYPTPRLVHPVRKIVFTMRSRDQGMGVARTKDIYGQGWTWFEAGLERFDADQECDDQCITDARFLSADSPGPRLPTCALRPIYPTISKRQRGEPDEPSDIDEGSPESGYVYDHGFMPVEERLIQRNRTRHRDMMTHVVQWSWTDDTDPESDAGEELSSKGRGRSTGDGRFVRDLKVGDVVTVWGKAKFPAWVNHIEKVKIDIYWAV